MTAAILAQAPSSFESDFMELFQHSLEETQRQGNRMDDEQDSDTTFFDSLRTLGWIQRGGCLTEPLSQAIHECIFHHVQQTICDEFEEECLFESVTEWKNAVVVSSTHTHIHYANEHPAKRY